MIKYLESQVSLILNSNCLKLKNENLDRRIYPKSVHFKHGCFWLGAIENGQEVDFTLSSILMFWEYVK